MIRVIVRHKSGETINDGINKITRKVCEVEIGGYKFDYNQVSFINGHTYSDEYLKTNILLHLVDIRNIYKEFEKFKNPKNIVDFQRYYGYDDCEKLLNAVDEIKQIGKRVKVKIPQKEIDFFLEVYSDGDKKLMKKASKKLSKYFKIVEE